MSVPPYGATFPPHVRWSGYPVERSLSWSDRIHMLYGDELDENSGGHLSGANRPNKTEFPPHWDEEKVVQEVRSVADNPAAVTELPNVWLAKGVRDEVTIWAYIRRDGSIATGHPVDGPGVKKNPPRRGA